MAVIIPEAIIADEIQSSLDILRAELNNPDISDEDTTLYGYFGTTSLSKGQYVMFDQIKSLLLLDPSKVDKSLKVFQSMPPKDTKSPSIYIQMGEENHDGGGNAIGDGAGIDNVEWSEADQEYKNRFLKKYMSRYIVVMISENCNEMTAIYHLVKCCLISSSASIALKGLENYKVRGTSIDLKGQIDFNLFYKTIEIKFSYGILVPNFTKNKYYLECFVTAVPESTEPDIDS